VVVLFGLEACLLVEDRDSQGDLVEVHGSQGGLEVVPSAWQFFLDHLVHLLVAFSTSRRNLKVDLLFEVVHQPYFDS